MSLRSRVNAAKRDIWPALAEWWQSKRPPGWTLDQHLSAPTTNCNVGEFELAILYAKLVAIRLKRELP